MEQEHIDSFNPRNCISGKMMRLSRVTANIFRKHLSPFGVTNSQVTLLFVLSKNNNLNQKELADIAILEKSSLSRNLTRLVDWGLVSKGDFPLIQITTKGRTLVNEIIPEWRKAMNEIETLLESEGMKAIDTLMKKLIE